MSSPKKVLVLDCAANHVAAGFFTSGPRGITLNEVEVETIGSDHANEQEWINAVHLGLRAISKRKKLSGPVHIIAPGHLQLMKFLKIPHVGKSKQEQIVKFEAQQNIPYPLNEVVWDYEVILDDGAEFEVALVAIKIEIVQELCDKIQSMGLQVEIVEPSSMSELNAFTYSYPEVDEGALLVNIGSKSSNFLFVDKHGFFVRNVALAGNTLTQAVADDLKIPFAQAEEVKLAVFSGQETDETPVAAVQRATESFHRRLNMEVTRSIVNFRRQTGSDAVTSIYLTGAGALAPGLAESLSEKQKIAIDWYDSLRNVEIGRKVPQEKLDLIRFQISEMVGAAQRSRPGSKAHFNLLPPALAKQLAFKKKKTYLLASMAVLVVAAALPIINFEHTAAVYAEQASSLEDELVPLRRLDSQIQQNQRRVGEIRERIDRLHRLVEARGSWVEFLNDLQGRLIEIEDVWLDRMVLVRSGAQPQPTGGGGILGGAQQQQQPAGDGTPRLQVSGRLLDRENPLSRVSAQSQDRVNRLLDLFSESEFVSEVRIESLITSEPGVLRFNVSFVLNTDKPL